MEPSGSSLFLNSTFTDSAAPRSRQIWVSSLSGSYFLALPIYSFIPEFISRLPSITTLAPLTIPDLRRILTEVHGSLVSQYTALLGYSGVEIRFTSAALDQICRKASERGGGARGLRGIMVRLQYVMHARVVGRRANVSLRKHCFWSQCMKSREYWWIVVLFFIGSDMLRRGSVWIVSRPHQVDTDVY